MNVFGLSFLVFLLIGVPITMVLALASLGYILVTGQMHLLVAFPQRIIAGVDQFVLLTVPLFILAGNLMNAGAITDRIIRFCEIIVGRLRGGLALVNVLASTLFAGVSGSAAADSAALGTVLIPGMHRAGYSLTFSAAITAVSSVIGPIIPPSIAMIVYAVLSGNSVAALFLASIVPGILMALGLMVYALVIAHRRGYPRAEPVTLREGVRATGGALPVLMLPLIILGGILGGIFTPTEAAAVAAAYALVIAAFVYRTLTWQNVTKAMYDSALTTSAVLLVVAMASIVSFVFSIGRIPDQVLAWILSITDNPTLILLAITVALLVLGAFLEPIGALILTVPILMPLGAELGLDPIHFGVVIVLNLVIGLSTPPVGLCLFIVCAISKEPLGRVSAAALPQLAVCILVLLLITFVPGLVTFLPELAGYGG
jgi:C4-dicarboxylate transporter, DctM subunit